MPVHYISPAAKKIPSFQVYSPGLFRLIGCEGACTPLGKGRHSIVLAKEIPLQILPSHTFYILCGQLALDCEIGFRYLLFKSSGWSVTQITLVSGIYESWRFSLNFQLPILIWMYSLMYTIPHHLWHILFVPIWQVSKLRFRQIM